MKSTVVPNRNMILLSLAIGYAVDIGASKVYYGAHSGDHAIYPDCRPDFVHAMNKVAKLANYEPVDIVTPYLNSSKTEILADGLSIGKLSYFIHGMNKVRTTVRINSMITRMRTVINFTSANIHSITNR